MKLQVKIKSSYGVERIYPVDQTAKIFAKLVGQKTLTMTEVELIKKLGYTVEVVKEQPVEL